jgi:hypothetical protein
MVLFDELGRILDDAHKNGIEVLAMKGVPATVHIHGNDLSVRAMADLDLLVRREDLEIFCRLLEKRGYVKSKMPIGPFVGDKARHLPPFVHSRRGATVEVHRGGDYLFEGLGASLMPDFFSSPRRATVDGRPVLFPSWETWVLQWAVHMVYTDAYLGKMRDLFDMAVFLHTLGGEVDWSEVIHPKRTKYLLRPLWMGLLLVERIFGAAIEARWKKRLRALGGQEFPAREFPEWMIRQALARERVVHILPLSVMAALSMPFHDPTWTPRFIGEFLRTFIAPPVEDLEEQYGLARGMFTSPILYGMRSFHLAAIIVDRIGGRLFEWRR